MKVKVESESRKTMIKMSERAIGEEKSKYIVAQKRISSGQAKEK